MSNTINSTMSQVFILDAIDDYCSYSVIVICSELYSNINVLLFNY